MENASEILPCPFCGGPAGGLTYLNQEKSNKGYMAHCGDCDAKVEGFNSMEEAIKAWNTRKSSKRSKLVPLSYDEAMKYSHEYGDRKDFMKFICKHFGTQQSKLVPLDEKSVEDCLKWALSPILDNKIFYETKEKLMKLGTPSVPSLEEIETELVQSSHDSIKGRYVYLGDVLNILHRLLTNGKEEK